MGLVAQREARAVNYFICRLLASCSAFRTSFRFVYRIIHGVPPPPTSCFGKVPLDSLVGRFAFLEEASLRNGAGVPDYPQALIFIREVDKPAPVHEHIFRLQNELALRHRTVAFGGLRR